LHETLFFPGSNLMTVHCSNPPYIYNFIHQTSLSSSLFQDPFQSFGFFGGERA